MAAPLDNKDVPEFNNTEQGRPNPNINPGTDEGAEIARHNETSIIAPVARDVEQPVHKESANDGDGDDDDDIPQSVYDKARDHNDQLTETERQLLLSRGDLVGLALAYPDSLTTDEIHDIFGWPPADVTRANIQRAVGNTLISTPSEMYARISNALDLGQFDTAIGDDEIILIMRLFHASENGDHNMKTPEDLGVPAFMAARTLLSRRLQMDHMIRRVVAERYFDLDVRRVAWPAGVSVSPPTFPPGSQGDRGQATREILIATDSLNEQHALGNISEEAFLARSESLRASLEGLWPGPPRIPLEIMVQQAIPAWVRERYIVVPTESWPRTPSQPILRADRCGAGPWPDCVSIEAPVDLFSEATGCHRLDRDPDWADLPEDEKETYRARSEARRLEAWAWFGRRLEREALERSPACPQPPPRAEPWVGIWSKPVDPAPEPDVPPREPDPRPGPPPVPFVGLFEVFRDEQVAENGGEGVDFWEVVRRWEALSDEERWSYDEKMQLVNNKALEEAWEGMPNAAAAADAAAPAEGM